VNHKRIFEEENMPCNAVATARAQVGQESLSKLLTDDVVRQVLADYLKRKYAHLNPREETAWSGVDFVVGNYRIHIQNGAVTVSGNWSGDSATCKMLADEITGFLTKAAGLLFQQKTRLAVASRYTISEEQRAPNGALVLSVEL
jgi:hypothetical protein